MNYRITDILELIEDAPHLVDIQNEIDGNFLLIPKRDAIQAFIEKQWFLGNERPLKGVEVTE